jgi:hypothetical protein
VPATSGAAVGVGVAVGFGGPAFAVADADE